MIWAPSFVTPTTPRADARLVAGNRIVGPNPPGNETLVSSSTVGNQNLL